jgi:hypothetical protein
MSVGIDWTAYCPPAKRRLQTALLTARMHSGKRAKIRELEAHSTVIDNGVFPRHSLVTVLLASGKEAIQPTTRR